MKIWYVFLAYLSISLSCGATAILHYRVNDTDAAAVAGGTVPGLGTPDGNVAFGAVGLSPDVPTEGVPAGAGNRSLVFTGDDGITAPGTQQLLNSVVDANGGFTMEAWFNYGGGGNVNSIIDYAGTEKLVRNESNSNAGFFINGNNATQVPLGAAGIGEWHYAAVVFTPTVGLSGSSIIGDLTLYYDGLTPANTIPGVTISDFGDSLNRTLAVGAHPMGFPGDFITGQIFEPRVSLGALSPSELLYVPEPGVGVLLVFGFLALWIRKHP